MTFDELWRTIKDMRVLPETAVIQIPQVLQNDTKKRLCKRSPQDVATIVLPAVDEINRGSIETVDALVRKWL